MLVRHVGIDGLMKRIPEAYQRAMVSAGLAASFVYQYGLDASEVDFFKFLEAF